MSKRRKTSGGLELSYVLPSRTIKRMATMLEPKAPKKRKPRPRPAAAPKVKAPKAPKVPKVPKVKPPKPPARSTGKRGHYMSGVPRSSKLAKGMSNRVSKGLIRMPTK